ncbi:D-alanyl-D-alanine carboxypeptidase family protein [Candidatus Nomurabacteria bacterium]|nr:D-alanyl-D-alanine carboxypeptidase family protein [Candidatus Nomurabacteria bacterium]
MKRLFLLTFLFALGICVTTQDVFALDPLSQPVGGVSAYTFKSEYPPNCASRNPAEQPEHLLIVPTNDQEIDSVYIYFHGLSTTPINTKPPRMCHGYLNLCDSVAKIAASGKNIAVIASVFDKQNASSKFREYNKAELECFIKKAEQELSSLGRGLGSDLNLVGHSAGGRSIMAATQNRITFAGMSPSRTIFFDPCYGNWCDNAIKTGYTGNLYFYGDPAERPKGTLPKIRELANAYPDKSKVRLVEMAPKTHSQIPGWCFTDHLLSDSCQGHAVNVAMEGSIGFTPAAAIAPTSGVLDAGQEQALEKHIEQLILKTNQQTVTPGFNIAGQVEETIDIEEAEGGKVDLRISLLGKYLAWAFSYSLMAIGTIAIVLIIFSGFQWMTSFGNASVIKAAQSRIGKALTGLALATLSYLILFAINPDLTRVGDLSIRVVTSDYTPPEADEISYSPSAGAAPTSGGATYVTKDNIAKPTWGSGEFDCSKKNSYKEAGVAPASSVVTYTCDGIKGNITTLPEAKQAVCNAGKIAKQKGYELIIGGASSTYRPFDRQVANWCGEGARKYKDTKTRKSFYATPGYSNHGLGRALDVSLAKNGKRLMNIDSKAQCKVDPAIIKTLAEIFYEADANFVRLETEIWHFEYGTSGQSARNRYDGYPSKCAGKPSGSISPIKGPNTPGLAPPPPSTVAAGTGSIPTAARGQSPAATANKCTFTENRWNRAQGRSVLARRETNYPYDQLKAENKGYISKVDPRCSICEEDLVTIDLAEIGLGNVRVTSGGSLKMCWAYAEQVTTILKAIKESGQFQLREVVGYRPLRSAGALDADGNRSGVSGHLYGMAIDLNASDNGLYNHCQNFDPIATPITPNNGCRKVAGGVWNPTAKPTRSLRAGSVPNELFKNAGWKWGGTDMSGGQRDFMDFSVYGYDFSI